MPGIIRRSYADIMRHQMKLVALVMVVSALAAVACTGSEPEPMPTIGATANPHSGGHTYPHSTTNTGTYSHAHPSADPNSNRYCGAYTFANQHTYTHTGSNGHAYSYSFADANGYSNRNSHS